MAVFIVTYDLNREPTQAHRDALREAIKKYSWARLSESCYALTAETTAKALFNHLKSFIDANDYLFIMPLQNGWWGYGDTAVVNWLNQRLTPSP